MIAVLLRRLYNNFIGSDNIVYGVLPTSADGAPATAVTLTAKNVAWTWGAWAQIAASVGTAEVQIVGATIENFVGAVTQGEVRIGTGAAGAEVEVARFQIAATPPIIFPKPIRVGAGIRVAGAYRTATGAADTVDVKLHILTGY
jgi:hypothetical protein